VTISFGLYIDSCDSSLQPVLSKGTAVSTMNIYKLNGNDNCYLSPIGKAWAIGNWKVA
jgi:hypothetical protein